MPRPDRKTRLKTRLIAVRNLDQRTRAATRARKLAAEFEAELGGDLTTAMHIAIERAAALTVVAEDARARRLAGDLTITLDDLVRTDRAAAAAVRALGLDRERESVAVPLRDRLLSLHGHAVEAPAQDSRGDAAGQSQECTSGLPIGSGGPSIDEGGSS
jgi:hypothetical protein